MVYTFHISVAALANDMFDHLARSHRSPHLVPFPPSLDFTNDLEKQAFPAFIAPPIVLDFIAPRFDHFHLYLKHSHMDHLIKFA